MPLTKKVLAGGMAVWWDRVFDSEDKIDIRSIDRGGGGGKAAAEFQKNWDEAHRQFQQYVQNLQPTEIHIPRKGSDGTDEGGGEEGGDEEEGRKQKRKQIDEEREEEDKGEVREGDHRMVVD